METRIKFFDMMQMRSSSNNLRREPSKPLLREISQHSFNNLDVLVNASPAFNPTASTSQLGFNHNGGQKTSTSISSQNLMNLKTIHETWSKIQDKPSFQAQPLLYNKPVIIKNENQKVLPNLNNLLNRQDSTPTMVHDKVKEGHIERFHSDKHRKEKDIHKNNIRFLEKLQSVRSDYIFEKILKKAKK